MLPFCLASLGPDKKVSNGPKVLGICGQRALRRRGKLPRARPSATLLALCPASLRYVSCGDGGIRRIKRGKGFVAGSAISVLHRFVSTPARWSAPAR